MTYSEATIKRILELCKVQNITILELANMIDLPQAVVESVLDGSDLELQIGTLHKIAIGLNMTISEFLDFPEMNNDFLKDF